MNYDRNGVLVRTSQPVRELRTVKRTILVDSRDRDPTKYVKVNAGASVSDPGDYVVSSSGTIGRVAEVHEEDLPCMLNTSVIRMRPASDALDRRFLFYFLKSPLFQEQIRSFA